MSSFDKNTTLGLTETWLNKEDKNIWSMKGTRKCFRVDQDNVCSQQEQGGGVAIFFPKRFNCKLREVLMIFYPAWFEGLWVEITRISLVYVTIDFEQNTLASSTTSL